MGKAEEIFKTQRQVFLTHLQGGCKPKVWIDLQLAEREVLGHIRAVASRGDSSCKGSVNITGMLANSDTVIGRHIYSYETTEGPPTVFHPLAGMDNKRTTRLTITVRRHSCSMKLAIIQEDICLNATHYSGM